MNRNTQAQANGIENISNDIFLTIVHEMNVAIVLHDAQQRVIFLNNSAEKILEVSLAEVFGQLPKELCNHETPELTQALIDSLKKDIKSPFLKFSYKTRSGKFLYIKACSIPIRDSLGEVTHTAVQLEDITYTHRLEKESIMAAKLSSIADMAYHLTHEINNPLTGIKLGLNTLNRTLKKHADINVVRSVLKDVNRIQGIVKSFLQARKTPFRPKKVPLNLIADIIKEVEFHLAGQLTTKDIKIDNCSWDEELYIFVDRNRIYQLFLNILLNAIHAITDTGTIKIRKGIASRTQKNDGVSPMFCIFITDTGEGFDSSHKKKLFEHLQSSRPGGSGLGLSICHDIISNHDGEMELRSEVGKGTVMKIYLPVTSE